MKKIVLLVLLAAGFKQLKAQQLTVPVLPDLKLSNRLSSNYFKPEAFNLLTTKPADSVNYIPDNQSIIVIYDNMPVAKISRSNVDHMPIYNPAQTGIRYTILIKKMEVNPVEPVVP